MGFGVGTSWPELWHSFLKHCKGKHDHAFVKITAKYTQEALNYLTRRCGLYYFYIIICRYICNISRCMIVIQLVCNKMCIWRVHLARAQSEALGLLLADGAPTVGRGKKFWAQKKAYTFSNSPCSGHDRKNLLKEKKCLCPKNQGGKCHFGWSFGVRPIFRPKTTFRPNVNTPVSP